MSTDPTGKGLLLKADVVADTFREEIVQALKSLPKPPKLVGILATSAAPSRFYAEFTKKQCTSLGFDFVLKEIGAALSPENGEGDGAEEAIMEANEDDSVDGIMVSGFGSRVPFVHHMLGIRRFITLSLAASRYVVSATLHRVGADLLIAGPLPSTTRLASKRCRGPSHCLPL